VTTGNEREDVILGRLGQRTTMLRKALSQGWERRPTKRPYSGSLKQTKRLTIREAAFSLAVRGAGTRPLAESGGARSAGRSRQPIPNRNRKTPGLCSAAALLAVAVDFNFCRFAVVPAGGARQSGKFRSMAFAAA